MNIFYYKTISSVLNMHSYEQMKKPGDEIMSVCCHFRFVDTGNNVHATLPT